MLRLFIELFWHWNFVNVHKLLWIYGFFIDFSHFDERLFSSLDFHSKLIDIDSLFDWLEYDVTNSNVMFSFTLDDALIFTSKQYFREKYFQDYLKFSCKPLKSADPRVATPKVCDDLKLDQSLEAFWIQFNLIVWKWIIEQLDGTETLACLILHYFVDS